MGTWSEVNSVMFPIALSSSSSSLLYPSWSQHPLDHLLHLHHSSPLPILRTSHYYFSCAPQLGWEATATESIVIPLDLQLGSQQSMVKMVEWSRNAMRMETRRWACANACSGRWSAGSNLLPSWCRCRCWSHRGVPLCTYHVPLLLTKIVGVLNCSLVSNCLFNVVIGADNFLGFLCLWGSVAVTLICLDASMPGRRMVSGIFAR